MGRRGSDDLRRRESEIREDFGARNVVHDKDEPAALVRIRPAVKPFGREHRVLCRLDQRGLSVTVGEGDDALDPQQIAAMCAGERAQRSGEVEPTDSAAKNYGEAVDAMR